MTASTLRGAAVLLALSAVLPATAQSAPTPKVPPEAPAAPAAPASPGSAAAALQLMRDKGIITQAEYAAAMGGAPAVAPAGAAGAAPDLVVVRAEQKRREPPPITSRWTASLYGFVEADFIYDSTQSFADLAGNTAIQPGNTYAGSHHRLQFSARATRFGFRFGAPEWGSVKSSAVLEVDFLGNQPSNATESATFNSPALRLRLAYLKLETPVVDLLLGQSWELFGWQTHFFPNTVELQGVPGQVFSRTIQLRASKSFRTDLVSIDLALAAARPPQRDAYVPDLQAGARVSLNGWKGVTTSGATATAVVPAAIGLSGTWRRFQVIEPLPAGGQGSAVATGWGYSIDALLPIIPVSGDNRANGLTFTGSFVNGRGIADQYANLTGGLSAAPAWAPAGYVPNVDPGLVAFAPDGTLHAIAWRSFILGLQYYLPPSGRLWVSANYSDLYSSNAQSYGAPSQVFTRSHWADGNLFWDATNAVRFGLEYAWFRQVYADGTPATDSRVQLSAYYLF